MKLGIGIITYNRDQQFGICLKAIEDHTKTQCVLVVADDGSTDFTAGFCRDMKLWHVTGRNRGVAWNKNRALFSLFAIARCDVAILLEDDAVPIENNWEHDWITASLRWGHINFAGNWFPAGSRISGAGTPADPFLSTAVSGQVEGFSADAIRYGGYLDSRFRGYGFAHVEQSRRLIRCGYGGHEAKLDGKKQPLYALIESPVAVVHQRSSGSDADRERNGRLIGQVLEDTSYRAPWTNETEMTEFRAEIDAARPDTLYGG
jgi:glycosyltransferase involved in cell wall biosynthesis